MSMTTFTLDAYAMFQRGMDTADIAKAMNRPEAIIHRAINRARSARLGLPSPYAERVENLARRA